jgi:hypothetical protein
VPAAVAQPGGIANQLIAAWKKWFGIAYMMDLPKPPVYGLMLDSEPLVYNHSECGANGAWYRMFERVSALEAAKLWPAAQVNEAAVYDFGIFKQTGKDYDKYILEDNARWIGAHPDQAICKGLNKPGCREVKRHIDLVLFSWWTDLPYMNLKVAGRMLESTPLKTEHDEKPPASVNLDQLGKWQRRVYQMKYGFPRFEHISYQMWCEMYEGYHMDDVTAVTGNAIWGSYLEDPKPTKGYGSSRIAELHPMWLPADAYKAILEGKVPPMSHIDPPLMHLHVDHFPHNYDCWNYITAWSEWFKEVNATWRS